MSINNNFFGPIEAEMRRINAEAALGREKERQFQIQQKRQAEANDQRLNQRRYDYMMAGYRDKSGTHESREMFGKGIGEMLGMPNFVPEVQKPTELQELAGQLKGLSSSVQGRYFEKLGLLEPQAPSAADEALANQRNSAATANYSRANLNKAKIKEIQSKSKELLKDKPLEQMSDEKLQKEATALTEQLKIISQKNRLGVTSFMPGTEKIAAQYQKRLSQIAQTIEARAQFKQAPDGTPHMLERPSDAPLKEGSSKFQNVSTDDLIRRRAELMKKIGAMK